jgi:hypothetical protein
MQQCLLDSCQGLDDGRILQIRLAVVVGLDDAKLGHRLSVDVGGQVTESTSRAQQVVLVAPEGSQMMRNPLRPCCSARRRQSRSLASICRVVFDHTSSTPWSPIS